MEIWLPGNDGQTISDPAKVANVEPVYVNRRSSFRADRSMQKYTTHLPILRCLWER